MLKRQLRKGHFGLGISFLLCLCLLVTMNTAVCSVSAQEKDAFVVVLDPGHDELHARGANGASGIVEEDMNLEIALACKKELEAAGIQVYMTRETTACPLEGSGASSEACLAWRTAYAASVGCDLYVSLHLNASGSNNGEYRTANGSLVFISSHQSYQSSLQKLAEEISTNLNTDCGIAINKKEGTTIKAQSKPGYDDGSLSDYYMVIRDSGYNGFPAVLIEHAYMDNWLDAQLLKNRGAEAFGKADARAIISWYQNGTGITKTSSPSSSNIASGSVNHEFLNVRLSANSSSSLITTLSKGDPLYIYRISGDWYQVLALHNGAYYEGYVNSSYVTMDAETQYPESLRTGSDQTSDQAGIEETSMTTGYVNFRYLNVRSGPGTSYEKIDELDHKQVVTITEELQDWYQVTYTSGETEKSGYVAAHYITINGYDSAFR